MIVGALLGLFRGASPPTVAELPKCDSAHAKESVTRLMKERSPGSAVRPEITDWTEIETSSASKERVECEATAVLNGELRIRLAFTFSYGEANQYGMVTSLKWVPLGPSRPSGRAPSGPRYGI